MGKNLLFLFLFFSVQNLSGQSTTGNLEGWIYNEKYQPIRGANVLFISGSLQGNRGTDTDDHGYFFIKALPVGIYSVKINHVAYQQVNINNIHLILGQTISLGEIHLTLKTYETEPVIVSGEKFSINTRSAANGKILSAGQFNKLPLERNYFQMAELLPYANHSYKGDGGTNFAGSTGIENRFFIDGAEVTSPTFGGTLFELPNNFIREVEVKTGGYQAEFQSSLGGIINAVTFSGSNEFHGKIFGYFTNNNFSRAPRMSLGQPPNGSYLNFDFGFGFGGAIIKNKLWFFAAYDPNSISEDVYVNGLGMQKSYFAEHKFAGKLTWSLNKNNLFAFSICGDPYKGRDVFSGGSLSVVNPEYSSADVSVFSASSFLKGIHTISNVLLLESSLSMRMLEETIKPISAKGSEPWFDDYTSGISSGGLGFYQNKPSINQFSAGIKGELTIKNHTIKAGLEYSINSTTRDSKQNGIEHNANGYIVYELFTQGTVKQNNFSTFIQDSWQIFPRLCFNAGVRWDPQWFIASDGSFAQKITDQVQPRLGLIYQPGVLGSQKITASFGRFYQPVMQALSIAYHIKDSYFNISSYPNDPRVDTGGAFHVPNLNPFIKNIPGVEGQYYDEYSLGYEHIIFSEFKIGIQGIYRSLGQGIEDGAVSLENQAKYGSRDVYGNPGSGMLSSLPKMKREFTALELTLERFSAKSFNFLCSYVLSRNWGNYDGLAETSDVTGGSSIGANISGQFELPERMANIDGLLPNDRTHVFKLSGSYVFDFGLTAGIIFQWMSGTPLNEFGRIPMFYSSTFLRQRGSVGRTPSIWDLNFRFMYDVSRFFSFGSSANLMLDVLHVASQRAIIDYDQYHYNTPDETGVNQDYMMPVQFQPPMSIRLGMEVDF